MKRFFRSALLFCLISILLAGTAFANVAPWPRLKVEVVNGPEEPYYLDVLEENDEWYEVRDDRYEEEGIDPQLLETLIAAVPEGWHAGTAQRGGVWGDLSGDNGVHRFTGMSFPRSYRILIAAKSGETWMSEPINHETLNTTITIDWASKTIRTAPIWLAYTLQILSTLIPTILLEGLLLRAFRFDWKKNRKPFMLVNLVTQGALAVVMGVLIVRSGAFIIYVWILPPIELAIALIEGGLYARFFQGQSKRRAFAYGVAANFASYILGFFTMSGMFSLIAAIF